MEKNTKKKLCFFTSGNMARRGVCIMKLHTIYLVMELVLTLASSRLHNPQNSTFLAPSRAHKKDPKCSSLHENSTRTNQLAYE